MATFDDSPPGRSGEPFLLVLLPGLLAGTLLAELLFFLNPDLPFSAASLLRAVSLYGGTLGLFSALVLGAATRLDRQRVRRLLPWALTTVLAAVALLNWVHASRFAYYLPSGLNIRLIKAAAWVSLIALVFFYTALLHSVHHRPYGIRSRVGMAVLALVSVYLMIERREAFRPRLSPPPLPSVIEAAQRPVLLVVGLEGASLDAILPLAEQGQLPFLGRLVREGAHGRLASLPPTEPAALWTSVATGKLPYKHGVLSDRALPAPFLPGDQLLALTPDGLGFRLWGGFGRRTQAANSRQRRSLALWEILSRLGVPSGMVGWPASHPVSGEESFAFSDRFFAGEFSSLSARPAELAERGELFRVGADELDPAQTAAFGDPAPLPLLTALSRDLWRQSLTSFLLDQRQETRAVFLVLPGLEEVSKLYFGAYAAVQLEGSKRSSLQEPSRLLIAYYRQVDRTLEGLWQRLSPPRLLALVSPYGYEAPGGWAKLLYELTGRGERGTAAGAPDGILMLLGDNLRGGRFLDDAALLDVAPTLLYGLGLPIARDLDGRVLTDAFAAEFLTRRPVTFVPSYETLESRRLEAVRPP